MMDYGGFYSVNITTKTPKKSCHFCRDFEFSLAQRIKNLTISRWRHEAPPCLPHSASTPISSDRSTACPDPKLASNATTTQNRYMDTRLKSIRRFSCPDPKLGLKFSFFHETNWKLSPSQSKWHEHQNPEDKFSYLMAWGWLLQFLCCFYSLWISYGS
jgi:hypothetical protein